MRCWLSPLLIACSAHQATALAQVSMTNKDQLSLHEVGHRTALHDSQVEVESDGELALDLRQSPGVSIGVSDDVVFGSVMVITLVPQKFVKDPAVQRAVQEGIEDMAEVSKLQVRDVGVSLSWLEDFPQAVLIEFNVTFRTPKARQVFTWRVATDGAKKLVFSICRELPGPFKGRCALPGGQLGPNDDLFLDLVETGEVSPTVQPTVPKKDQASPTVQPTVPKKDQASPTIQPTVFKKDQVSPTVQPTVPKKEQVSPIVQPTVSKKNQVPTTVPTTVQPTVPPPKCYGAIHLTPPGPARLFVRDRQWQEAVAMAISNVVPVSRLQVGTLMALSGKAVRVDFWFNHQKGICSEATILRIRKAQTHIRNLAAEQVSGWTLNSKDLVREFPVFGRMLLQVPSASLFAESKSALEAMHTAVAEVAAISGPEDEGELSVTTVNVSVTALANVSNAVRVDFRVAFANARDRQVFAWDFAQDGGNNFAYVANGQVRACEDRCELPGRDQGEAMMTELDKQFGTLEMRVERPWTFASGNLTQEAIVLAISELAAVPSRQVGILAMVAYRHKVTIDFWISSSNATLRQDAVRRVDLAGLPRFLRCALAHLDRLHERARTKISNDVGSGSIMLEVPETQSFARSSSVLQALRSAFSQFAPKLVRQVVRVDVVSDLWQDPQLVRVDFWVLVNKPQLVENFTRAIAVDGGESFVAGINKLVPEPFKGRCRLPVPSQPQANSTSVVVSTSAGNTSHEATAGVASRSVGNVTLPPQPYGTMLLQIIFAYDSRQEPLRREALARTIAEVALVPRSQVGIMLSLQSPVILKVDFWVLSADVTLQQAAVQRVNALWNMTNVHRYWGRVGQQAGTNPIVLVSGGTVASGTDRFSCS